MRNMVSTEFADADDFYLGVKACRGAGVLIRSTIYENSIYVVIGDPDTNIFELWSMYGEVVVSTGEVVLDCNEMQYYWVNKANGLLTVGRGLQSGTDIVLTHELPEGLNWNEVYFVNLGDSVTEFEKQVKAPPFALLKALCDLSVKIRSSWRLQQSS
ncbi:hypothetical protein CAPTEDRAFT_190941, partial [Capitella teleta]